MTIYDRAAFPRHKVCGEFLSPEIVSLLERLGVWEEMLAARPAAIQQVRISLGRLDRRAPLPQPAFGLSRYSFDDLLLRAACRAGARFVRSDAPRPIPAPAILATGRRADLGDVPKRDRLFGFKAHFDGPPSDAVELFFWGRAYVGVNPVEGGATNVCGLAPQEALEAVGFDVGSFGLACPALAERLAGMKRRFDWIFTGPLEFRQRFREGMPGAYRAGDALSFVDPFTGTGLLSAVLTGSISGTAAASGDTIERYEGTCKGKVRAPFLLSSGIRRILASHWAETLGAIVDPVWLYHATRPRLRR